MPRPHETVPGRLDAGQNNEGRTWSHCGTLTNRWGTQLEQGRFRLSRDSTSGQGSWQANNDAHRSQAKDGWWPEFAWAGRPQTSARRPQNEGKQGRRERAKKGGGGWWFLPGTAAANEGELDKSYSVQSPCVSPSRDPRGISTTREKLETKEELKTETYQCLAWGKWGNVDGSLATVQARWSPEELSPSLDLPLDLLSLSPF